MLQVGETGTEEEEEDIWNENAITLLITRQEFQRYLQYLQQGKVEN
jgi:hypothetical protein